MQTAAVIIASPGLGAYTPQMLRYETIELPDLAEGEVRVRVVYLSLDPTNRNWLKLLSKNTLQLKGALELRVGGPMLGQVLGVVEQSRSPSFKPGDLVAALGEWQEHINASADRLDRIELADNEPLSAYHTLFSHVGMAAFTGVYDVLELRRGQTLLVSGAAGATGSVVVEMARHVGARVIGIAGGPDKCRHVVEDLGADAAIDYRNEDVGAALARLCPEGIDAFFDNVGGETLDAALPHMTLEGRIALCGVMADYDLPPDQVHGVRNMYYVVIRALRIQGLLAGRTGTPKAEKIAQLRKLFAEGVIRHRPHIVPGLERAPDYLAMLFRGENRGKLIVEVSDPPTSASAGVHG